MTEASKTLNLSQEQASRLAAYSQSKEFAETVKNHNPTTVGLWKVRTGEDGMSGRSPEHLGYFEGRLSDVMSHLVLLQPSFQGFHTWGSIDLVESVKTNLDKIQQTLNLRDEIARKRKELEALEAQQG